LNALGRLLAVGSEWGSYVAPIGGSAGRGLAREVAEEASEQLGRQGARPASRELKPVVIGENMERVMRYAGQRYLTIKNFVPDDAFQAAFTEGLEVALALNRQWITQMMQQGRMIIDIGPEFAARRAAHPYRPSVFYELERRLLKGYPHYRKVFLRRGSYGGVPGLDPDSEFWWR
jgi:hypothetical protein